MTVDERLEFLLTSTESLHASCQQLHATVQKQAELITRHEQRWELVRRAMLAALEAGLRNGDEGQEG